MILPPPRKKDQLVVTPSVSFAVVDRANAEVFLTV